MMPYGSSWEEELNLLFAALPPRIASAAQRLSQGRGDLLEVVLDLGREPEARFTDGEAILDSANGRQRGDRLRHRARRSLR